jgi:hypothetical protein
MKKLLSVLLGLSLLGSVSIAYTVPGTAVVGDTITAGMLNDPFNNGSLKLSSFKPLADSVTAFQLQNSSGASHFNWDSSNNRIGIGIASADPSNTLTLNAPDGAIFNYARSSGTAGDYVGLTVKNLNATGNASSGLQFVTNDQNVTLKSVRTANDNGIDFVIEQKFASGNSTETLRIRENGGATFVNSVTAESVSATNLIGTNITGTTATIGTYNALSSTTTNNIIIVGTNVLSTPRSGELKMSGTTLYYYDGSQWKAIATD